MTHNHDKKKKPVFRAAACYGCGKNEVKTDDLVQESVQTVGDDSVLSVRGVLAVADGVGGGVRSDLISKALLEQLYCILPFATERFSNHLRGHWNPLEDVLDADDADTMLVKKNLDAACFAALSSAKLPPEFYDQASTTLCFAALVRKPVGDQRGILVIGNVGDSGAVVMRGNKVVCRSVLGCHRHNQPHQLGKFSSFSYVQEFMTVQIVLVKEGDVVVLGTDGMFDNLNSTFISDVIVVFSESRNPKHVAKALVCHSRIAMRCPEGKPDDVAVSVAIV